MVRSLPSGCSRLKCAACFPISCQENPNATRLLFAPTGRMLEQGEGYFNDTYLLLLSVHGGVTSRFTLGGGMSVVPLANFTDNALYIMPKIGLVASPKF